jgi:hypothetical protein
LAIAIESQLLHIELAGTAAELLEAERGGGHGRCAQQRGNGASQQQGRWKGRTGHGATLGQQGSGAKAHQNGEDHARAT